MPHSCITRQSVDIKASFSSCVIEKDVKVNIMRFRTLCSIEFQGSCMVAKTRIYHGLKIVFLESTVNRLSVDASFLHNETVRGHKKQVFPAV